jgi:hypothetical protein
MLSSSSSTQDWNTKCNKLEYGLLSYIGDFYNSVILKGHWQLFIRQHTNDCNII